MPLAPRTRREYELALRRLGFRQPGQFDGFDAASGHVAPAMYEHLGNSGRLMLRAAIRWAYAEAGLEEEGAQLASTIPLQHEVKRLAEFPSREDVARFTQAVLALPDPDGALLLVLIGLGLRAEEVLTLRREAVVAALKPDGVLRFVRKGQKEADLPVSPVREPLRKLLQRQRIDPGAMPGVVAPSWEELWQVFSVTQRGAYEHLRRLVPRVAQRAGCTTRWTPHTIRHAFATELVRDGAPLTLVQRALGHASYQTTANKYVHLDTTDLDRWMNRKQGV